MVGENDDLDDVIKTAEGLMDANRRKKTDAEKWIYVLNHDIVMLAERCKRAESERDAAGAQVVDLLSRLKAMFDDCKGYPATAERARVAEADAAALRVELAGERNDARSKVARLVARTEELEAMADRILAERDALGAAAVEVEAVLRGRFESLHTTGNPVHAAMYGRLADQLRDALNDARKQRHETRPGSAKYAFNLPPYSPPVAQLEAEIALLHQQREAITRGLVYETYDDEGGGPFWVWCWKGVVQDPVSDFAEGIVRMMATALNRERPAVDAIDDL